MDYLSSMETLNFSDYKQYAVDFKPAYYTLVESEDTMTSFNTVLKMELAKLASLRLSCKDKED